jgi:hypothetical protein
MKLIKVKKNAPLTLKKRRNFLFPFNISPTVQIHLKFDIPVWMYFVFLQIRILYLKIENQDVLQNYQLSIGGKK